MRAFAAGVVAAVLIAVVAALVLNRLPHSAGEAYQSEQGNVRL